VWTLLCLSSQVTPTQLHTEYEVDQLLANTSLGCEVMRDLNVRRAASSVVMFFLFAAAKQGTKQCSESEKRKREDNKLTIFFVVCMDDLKVLNDF
jgi:hypothetical protein